MWDFDALAGNTTLQSASRPDVPPWFLGLDVHLPGMYRRLSRRANLPIGLDFGWASWIGLLIGIDLVKRTGEALFSIINTTGFQSVWPEQPGSSKLRSGD